MQVHSALRSPSQNASGPLTKLARSGPALRASQSRRRFLRTLALSSVAVGLARPGRAAAAASASQQRTADLSYLRGLAQRVLESATVAPSGRIPDGKVNTTGRQLRLPGGTLNYYPAFWIRDAAMMLGGDFISADEIAGWVQVVAAFQPGAEGLTYGRLWIPPFSIPDHISLRGVAYWFPGSEADREKGVYGFLPPADNAFFFVQMVHEHWRLSGSLSFFNAKVQTAWGGQRLSEVCLGAFDSVAVDKGTGLVVCEATAGRSRADWGFCDAIRKSGLCLMPSLLRWRAAQQLIALFKANGQTAEVKRLRAEAKHIQASLVPTFFQALPEAGGRKTGCLLSATGLGRKEDVWSAAFAVWLGVLPRDAERPVARHLLALYEGEGTVFEGQVRHLPPAGEWGGYWEQALCAAEEYQNGGFWGTPTGWFITALRRVDAEAADRMLAEYVAHLRANEAQGAPWEWLNPKIQRRVNPRYASSAGLVYLALTSR
jgi:hypothetical protein